MTAKEDKRQAKSKAQPAQQLIGYSIVFVEQPDAEEPTTATINPAWVEFFNEARRLAELAQQRRAMRQRDLHPCQQEDNSN